MVFRVIIHLETIFILEILHKEEEEVDEETKREEVINGERPFLVKKEKKR